MYIIIILFLIGIIFFTVKNINAQVHVENKAYDAMLSTLLKHNVPEMSVEESKKDSTAIRLDARAKKEYDVSHLENAIWVGYDDFDISRISAVNKNEEVIVYCSVGYRSEKITQKLIDAGYTNVSNLYGGIFEWVNQKNTVVDSNNQPTQRIHAYSKTWGVWLSRGEKVYD